eukprot:jgi/Mesen1/6446/ME000033S05744
MTQAMRAMLRGLVILFAVACLLRGADAKSCKDDLDCPLKQCCTGTYEKPGYCSPQAYVNGTYVCKDCQSRAGLYGGGPTSCPPDASVCCADGTCAKTATECNSQSGKRHARPSLAIAICHQHAPSAGGNYTNPGLCVTQRMVNGKQTCPNCQGSQRNGAACPKEASLCCNDGTCQKTIEGCTCSYSTDCDATACCTGNYTTPGKCSTSPFVCGDCTQFVAGFTSCPAKKSVCCVDGSCQASLSLCTCTSNSGCSGKSCCTGTLAKPGHCTPSPYVNGTQVCPDCHEAFTGFSSCPPGRSVCCLDGSCQQNLGGCGCRTQGECPDGYCCNGNSSFAGVCTATPFKNGKQVCPQCGDLGDQNMACPASASVCCADGSCKASLAGCACKENYDCPTSTCCTGFSHGKKGTRFSFIKGLQVCTNCTSFISREVNCPATARQCCTDGLCKAKC